MGTLDTVFKERLLHIFPQVQGNTIFFFKSSMKYEGS